MKLSPLVGILGHRQVGKTTFIEKKSDSYYVLDKKTELEAATLDPEKYLSERAGSRVALDECQAVPALFPELKEWVRTHKKPGQFILSGSVRFTSREAIKESLTGRIVNLEMLPFLRSEINQEPLPDFLLRAIKTRDFSRWIHDLSFEKKKTQTLHEDIKKYWIHGGLPGVCFLRDAKQRAFKLEEQLITILDRDVRLVRKTTLPLSEIRSVLNEIALFQGIPFEMSALQKKTGISAPTLKKLLFAFEAVFLIRSMRIQGSTQGLVYFFEDQAEANHIARQSYQPDEVFTHYLFTQLRGQFSYRLGENHTAFQYRTRGEALIPLCYQTDEGIVGILPTASQALSTEDHYAQNSGSIRSFLSTYADAKVLMVHMKNEPPKIFSNRILSVPAGMLT